MLVEHHLGFLNSGNFNHRQGLDAEMHHHTKFHENRSICYGRIAIYFSRGRSSGILKLSQA